ncbi:MAG: flagellar hook capping protein [Desulfamplus sp.]|nr:flagellar hook capping protein [Desulfamplus sp.]
MTIDATGRSSLEKLAGSYKTSTEKQDKEDYLGREDFLTMLVAQLQNQDPLNPMQGSDFSAQLAQFSSLEQLLNLNESMKTMVSAFENSSEVDVMKYMGKSITGEVNSIDVSDGTPSKGFYKLSSMSDVMVTVYNSEGHAVKTIYPGQQVPGDYDIGWDGTDYHGKTVPDGSYSYGVMANRGNGFTAIPTSISGVVEGITYQNGKPYLMVDGFPVSPDSLVTVSQPPTPTTDSSTSPMSMLDYLGKTISYSDNLLLVEGEKISGNGIQFTLDAPEDVQIQILDSNGNEINMLSIPADGTAMGKNVFQWDGTDIANDKVPNGIYAYRVASPSGNVSMDNSGEVTGIKNFNGSQYFVVGNHDDIVTLSSVLGVE